MHDKYRRIYDDDVMIFMYIYFVVGIIHSDLKPSNFLIVCGRLKLIDFGIASRLSSDMTSVIKNVQVGTFNYISPEAVLDSRDSGSPGDGKPRIRVCKISLTLHYQICLDLIA